MNEAKLLSIVVPVFNEEGNLRPLIKRLRAALEPSVPRYELIFIDDGSSDSSWEILRELADEDARVRAVRLSRNFGHQVAISAGMEYASGDAVVMMDADLQHPPEIVPELYANWKEGFDVVYTIREGREHAGWFKRMTASAFYKLINATGDVKVVPNAPDFRLLDRRVVNALLAMPERGRFVRGLVSWVGFRQTGVPFVAQPRHDGKTKYQFARMLMFSLDGLTAFSSFPLRVSAYMGLVAAVVGLPYGIWALYARFVLHITEPGWTSLLSAVLFLGGVQLIAIGIIGEYLRRIYDEVKGRPLYLTQEAVGFQRRDKGPEKTSKPTETAVRS